MNIEAIPTYPCEFVRSAWDRKSGSQGKLSPCKCMAVKQVELADGTVLRFCAKHAQQFAEPVRFIPCGA